MGVSDDLIGFKESTKRNSKTYKRCRGPSTSSMRTTRQQKWTKQRYSSFRDEMATYISKGHYETNMLPDSKTGAKRSTNQSPKDTGEQRVLSKKEIEMNQFQKGRWAFHAYKKGHILEANVINGLRHGNRKLKYKLEHLQ